MNTKMSKWSLPHTAFPKDPSDHVALIKFFEKV